MCNPSHTNYVSQLGFCIDGGLPKHFPQNKLLRKWQTCEITEFTKDFNSYNDLEVKHTLARAHTHTHTETTVLNP